MLFVQAILSAVDAKVSNRPTAYAVGHFSSSSVPYRMRPPQNHDLRGAPIIPGLVPVSKLPPVRRQQKKAYRRSNALEWVLISCLRYELWTLRKLGSISGARLNRSNGAEQPICLIVGTGCEIERVGARIPATAQR